MSIKVREDGSYLNASSHTEVIRAMLQSDAHQRLAALTAITNSAGGSAGSVITLHSVALANAANDSTSLADETETQAAYGTVKDALLEIATETNQMAALLGIDTVTYNGGGTSADGTVGAVTVAVAAAGTGVQAANMNTMAALFNQALVTLTAKVNELCRACGIAELSMVGNSGAAETAYNSTVAALTIATGTAADPGVTKVAVDAELAVQRTNAVSLAAKLVLLATTTDPLVIAG